MNQNLLHNKMLNCMANFNCIIDYSYNSIYNCKYKIKLFTKLYVIMCACISNGVRHT